MIAEGRAPGPKRSAAAPLMNPLVPVKAGVDQNPIAISGRPAGRRRRRSRARDAGTLDPPRSAAFRRPRRPLTLGCLAPGTPAEPWNHPLFLAVASIDPLHALPVSKPDRVGELKSSPPCQQRAYPTWVMSGRTSRIGKLFRLHTGGAADRVRAAVADRDDVDFIAKRPAADRCRSRSSRVAEPPRQAAPQARSDVCFGAAPSLSGTAGLDGKRNGRSGAGRTRQQTFPLWRGLAGNCLSAYRMGGKPPLG